MNNPIFEMRNLEYKNNNNLLLKIKKFEIHRGACYLFKGDMGSGKTLLLDILNKSNSSYKGEVVYDGVNLKKYSTKNYNREISVVHQVQRRPFFTTVEQYIYKNIKKTNPKNKADKILNSISKAMNLKFLLKINVRKLTPPQFRWVDLAAKIASNPKVLFIDEMEQHLSKENINILSKLLYRKCNYDGVTLVCSSLNARLFSSLVSVTISLKHGRISSLRSRSRKK